MNPTYLTHFGLTQVPFTKEVADAELWLPPSKKALCDELTEGLEEHASVLLVGEPGVGKTCVLRALRHQLPQNGYRLTYCHNATLGRRDFYRHLCMALGLSPSATAAGLFYAVSTHVETLGRERVHPVFLLDEAHLLHQDTLDHLHILLNYEWDRSALLSLVLVGLPELEDRLTMRRNRALHSRIHRRLRIGALTAQDTEAYIRYRMSAADCEREVFASDALGMMHEAAHGAHRDLDRIATASLRIAARRKKKLVERDVVAHVLDADARGGEESSP